MTSFQLASVRSVQLTLNTLIHQVNFLEFTSSMTSIAKIESMKSKDMESKDRSLIASTAGNVSRSI